MVPEIITPEASEKAALAAQMLEVVLHSTVTSPMEYEEATARLREIKSRKTALEEERKKITRPMDAAKKNVLDFFRKPLSFLAQAESTMKRAMLTWDREVEAKRAAAEAKRQEIARKEQERLEARAVKAAEKGRVETAQVLQEAADSIPVPIVPRADPRPPGVSVRSTWIAKVTDKRALIQGVAEGRVPAAVLEINHGALNAQARALRGELDYPGVEAVEQKSMAIR